MSAIWSNGINCSIHRCTIKWNTSEMCHTNDQYVTKIYPTQCDNVYNAMNHYMITRDQNKTHCYCEQVLWYARCYRTQTPTNTFTWCPWNFIYTIRRSDYVCECTRLLLCLICQCYSWINIFNSICLLKMKWKKNTFIGARSTSQFIYDANAAHILFILFNFEGKRRAFRLHCAFQFVVNAMRWKWNAIVCLAFFEIYQSIPMWNSNE